jgi:hypothetical protein
VLRAEYSAKKIAISRLLRLLLFGLVTAALSSALPTTGLCQGSTSSEPPLTASGYWRRLALGFALSLAAHEAAHVITAYAVGSHPYFAFDKGRPTIFSGIDSRKEPHKQFLFSAAGLTTQALIDEAILDIPHSRGGAIERGILAGGIATTLFYITLGRNGSVSDINFMARTSSYSKTQLSLIFGGFSAIHAVRIWRDPRYGHFFVRPDGDGAAVGFFY